MKKHKQIQRRREVAKTEDNKARATKDRVASKVPEHKSKQKNENWRSRFALHKNLKG